MAKRYQRDTLEMQLQAIQGTGPWSRGSKRSERIVTVTLVWPRPLVASRVALQTHTFTASGLDVAGKDWSERILFKETVEGPFGVIAQISESMSAQQLAKVAAALGTMILRAAGNEAARVAVGPGLAALARFPFTYVAGELSSLGKTARVVAAGRATLMPGQRGPVEIPLAVPEDVIRLRRSTRAGRTKTRRETLHKQGEPAGTIRFDIDYYRD